MPRDEKRIEENCRNLARKEGGWFLKVDPRWETGLIDRLLIMPGGFVAFCELKRPKDGSFSPKQKLWRRRLEKLGCRYADIWSEDDFEKLLTEAREWRSKTKSTGG